MIDENIFFREAALRLTGDLNIGQAMMAFINYAGQYLPIDRCWVDVFENPDFSDKVVILADVDKHGVKHENLVLPIPPKVRDFARFMIDRKIISRTPDGLGMKIEVDIHDRISDTLTEIDLPEEYRRMITSRNRHSPFVNVLDNIREHEMTRFLSEELNLPAMPALMITLIIGQTAFGSYIIMNYSGEQYTDEQISLLANIRQVISIAVVNNLNYRKVSELKNLLEDENRFLHNEIKDMRESEIIGADFGLKPTMELVKQVARQDSPVLLLGETGVGKEVIASAIHYSSLKYAGPFVRVNCGAIPESLIDSELFGHEKGAFTGAITQKKGRFERANGGTIFLDEVGELPPEAQVRLLRVLQEREIERVGGTAPIKLDLRILAATHRNLEEMVREGTFREDLFFRLNVFPIEIPPLRRRKIDIPALVAHILMVKSREMKLNKLPVFATHAMDQLLAHDWPGNVRELENAIERAMIIHRDKPLDFAFLFGPKTAETAGTRTMTPVTGSLRYDDVVREHIQQVLSQAEGKIHGPGGAAELLGVNPSTLRKRMRRLEIPFGRSAV